MSPSAQDYFASLLDIAAPFQTMFAKLTRSQQGQVEADIKEPCRSMRWATRSHCRLMIRIVVGREGP